MKNLAKLSLMLLPYSLVACGSDKSVQAQTAQANLCDTYAQKADSCTAGISQDPNYAADVAEELAGCKIDVENVPACSAAMKAANTCLLAHTCGQILSDETASCDDVLIDVNSACSDMTSNEKTYTGKFLKRARMH